MEPHEIPGFIHGKWSGDYQHFISFKDKVEDTLELKGLKYMLTDVPEYDLVQPVPITAEFNKYLERSDITLATIRSLLGEIPLKRVQDIFNNVALTARRKAIHVMARFGQQNVANVLIASAEIDEELTLIPPATTFQEAQILSALLLQKQRLLEAMGQGMSEPKLKLLFMKKTAHSLFDHLISKINDNPAWTFLDAVTQLETDARLDKVRKPSRNLEDIVEKRKRTDDLISPTIMAAAAIHDSSIEIPRICFNCNNYGHKANACLALFCSRCNAIWSIGDPQRHGYYNCPVHSEASRGRGGRAGVAGRGGRGYGGRALNVYQSTLPAARVNSMMVQVDPFSEEKYAPDTFQRDIKAWEAACEFENTDSTFYTSKL